MYRVLVGGLPVGVTDYLSVAFWTKKDADSLLARLTAAGFDEVDVKHPSHDLTGFTVEIAFSAGIFPVRVILQKRFKGKWVLALVRSTETVMVEVPPDVLPVVTLYVQQDAEMLAPLFKLRLKSSITIEVEPLSEGMEAKLGAVEIEAA